MKGDYYRYLAEVAVADAKAGQSKPAFLHCVFVLPVVFVFLFLMQKIHKILSRKLPSLNSTLSDNDTAAHRGR